MSKAKKGAKKPAAGADAEYSGPNIYQELRTKGISELVVNLEAPIDVLISENVEFEILVERIQWQNELLAADNLKLLSRDQITATAINWEGVKKQAN